MRQKLKTIFTTLLVIAIPVVAIITLIHIYRSDDIVDVTNQTYVQEPLTVTENHIQISNLKASYETFDESNVYGELIMRYQLSNGEDYQDQSSTKLSRITVSLTTDNCTKYLKNTISTSIGLNTANRSMVTNK